MIFLKHGRVRLSFITNFYSTISNANINATAEKNTSNAISNDAIAYAINAQPELKKFDQSQLIRLYETLVSEQGFTKKNFHTILTTDPTIVQRNPIKIIKSLECWRTTQFGDKHLFELFEHYPQFLDFTDEKHLRAKIAHLRQYALTLNSVWRLFMLSPNILIDSQHIINAKINYFDKNMRVDVTDVTKSTAFAHDLRTIETRHVFLERLGLYKKRSLKADPLEQSKNPRMHRIMDTTDDEFAEKVCSVTIDEFEVFKVLYEKEMNQRQSSNDDEND